MANHTIVFTDEPGLKVEGSEEADAITFGVKPSLLPTLRSQPAVYYDSDSRAHVFGALHPLATYRNVGYAGDVDNRPLVALIDVTQLAKVAKKQGIAANDLAFETFAGLNKEYLDSGVIQREEMERLRDRFPWLLEAIETTPVGVGLWVHRTNNVTGGKIDGVILDAGFFFDRDGEIVDQIDMIADRVDNIVGGAEAELATVRAWRDTTEHPRPPEYYARRMLSILDEAADDVRLLVDSAQQYLAHASAEEEGSSDTRSRKSTVRGRRRTDPRQKIADRLACEGTLAGLKEYARRVDVPLYADGRTLRKAQLLASLKEKGYC